MATIAEVLKEVGSDVGLAVAALEIEMDEEKPRKTLLEALGEIIDLEPEVENEEGGDDSSSDDELESSPAATEVRRTHFVEVGTPYMRMTEDG